MQKDITGQSVLFPNLSRRPVVAKFDQRHGSSDGGAILLKACDANQLRALLSAAAYVLMQELRLSARGGECARAQVSTLRERLLKIGVWVERSVRRIVLHLPASFAYHKDWLRIARSVGAAPA